jgi:hypothetical protein
MLDFRTCIISPLKSERAFLQKRHVIGEDIRDFADDGKVELYYFGQGEDREIIAQPGLEPEDFPVRSAKAETPRVFLFLDPNERKRPDGTFVYEVEVLVDDMYNIPSDPDNIVAKWNDSNTGVDDLFRAIKEAGYKGHYTSGRGFDCIEWYYPLVAKKAVLFT